MANRMFSMLSLAATITLGFEFLPEDVQGADGPTVTIPGGAKFIGK